MDTLNTLKLAVSALVLTTASGITVAGEKEELLKLKSTTESLIKQLVKQGVLTEQTAKQMFKQADADASKLAEQTETKAAISNAAAIGPVVQDEIRVPYVPDFVKDEIREQVRTELRQDVTNDVITHAKKEGWGLADALPDWTRKFKLSGDIRLRYESVFMADNNDGSLSIFPYYPNGQAINTLGGSQNAGLDIVRNTTEDNQRFRERVRLGIDVDIAQGLKAGVRLASGNMRDPVSTNQTMGQTGDKYQFTLDRAYLQYDDLTSKGFNWLTVTGGRMKNPFFVAGGEFSGGSELVWDTDLSFEGFSSTFRYNLGDKQTIGDGAQLIYATAGAFPIQEAPFSSNDKWLFGGQIGMDWGFKNNDKLKFGIAYFDYTDITAKPNTSFSGTCDLNTRENNASTPEFLQGGNTLASICRDGSYNDPIVSQFPGQVGLASDFNIIDVNLRYDMALFDPIHVTFSGDFAKNVGFNPNDVAAARILGGALGSGAVDRQTNAWQLRADVGSANFYKKGGWNTFLAYKRVERDAVLDAFTDSDFHVGGTNAKGWVLGANYSLIDNVWLTSRWLTADTISGPPFGVDVVQVDVNTRF
ncbi:MAG: putative porin [Methylococcales bacterium]|nr:putative porin [Methylococcales bacterium]